MVALAAKASGFMRPKRLADERCPTLPMEGIQVRPAKKARFGIDERQTSGNPVDERVPTDIIELYDVVIAIQPMQLCLFIALGVSPLRLGRNRGTH
ncbi:MAG: hypothetical protein ACK4P4_15800 [Allorhizobium sp.]